MPYQDNRVFRKLRNILYEIFYHRKILLVNII
nr:MAG TPA: hypothetical protein [Caudoviricetes sp.]